MSPPTPAADARSPGELAGRQPLSGIRVIDLTRLLPGGWATLMLADLGAEVVKIENPKVGGDNARAAHPRYRGNGGSESVYFCNVNRNKRSVALDVSTDAGREALFALVAGADVVVENFRAGVADRLGIGYRALRERFPRLIYCALTGYGSTGSRAAMAGHDLNIAGMSGLLQPDDSRPPEMPAMLMGDYAGSTMALVGILAALVERQRNGRGALIDASMQDGVASWTATQITAVFARTVDPDERRTLEGWGTNPRYGIYRTRDGKYLTVSLLEKKFWDQFCRRYGRPDLINDAESEADRLTSHGERGVRYREFLESLFLQRDRDAWVAEMQAHAIPVCPVLTLEEAYRSAFAAERRHYFEVLVPQLGRAVPQLGFPFRMTLSDGSDAFVLRHPPPALGEGNSAFLGGAR